MRALLIPLLLLAGCTAPAPVAPSAPAPAEFPATSPARGTAQLLVEPRIAAAGGLVTLVLRNGSEYSLGFNLCSSGLEQMRGSAWTSVPQDRACTRQLNVIDPGREARLDLRLPAALPAGQYRFLTGVTFQRDTPERTITYRSETVHSDSFAVRR